MKIKKIRDFLRKNEKLSFCIRALLVYWVCLFLAAHSGIYEQGITKNYFYSIVIIFIVVYRLICFAVLPGVLAVWLLEIYLARRPSATQGGIHEQ